MKQIVNGKTYNTETATMIDSYWNGLNNGDFCHVRESLYITKKGNYFLGGSGGPMSKYSESYGNSRSGSSKIIPLSKEEAFEWAQSKSESNKVEQFFPDMIEEA